MSTTDSENVLAIVDFSQTRRNRGEYHMIGVMVVLGMRILPREVGHKKNAMEDETHDIVHELVGREATMAALVGKNPKTGPREALVAPVHQPAGPVD